ncbi:murein biosynthesis integral membrane protein MurJ [Candidatus Acidulodesulfobacterium sp. H_13]|uniref:murein biosynthesis integral membrane protein MurJ n=1 Tax=Candidatus Acidulodesulfobacterium sp. H_13 TaxID=3395470 RepID=UPI003AF6218E
MRSQSKNHEIVRNLSVVSFFTLISRILGLLRDIFIAYFFGAGAVTDAFFVAFRIPNLFRRLFGEGGISASFIPVYSESLSKGSESEASDLFKTVFTALFFILLFLSLVGFLFSFLFVTITAPGFLHIPAQFQLTVFLTKIMFPYIFLIGLTAFFAGVLNVHGSYAPGAMYPIILNILFIVSAVFLRPFFHPGIYALAIGVMIGGILQLLSQIYYIKRKKIKLGFKFNFRNSAVRTVFKLLTPSLLGMAVIQLNLLFDTLLASFLSPGSISFLYYGDRLYQFPLGVFAIALQTAIFPTLSASFARGNIKEIDNAFNFSASLMFFIIIPSSIGLILLRSSLVRLIYMHGIFNSADVQKTASVLLFFTIGLWASSLLKTVIPVFYSMKDTKTPVNAAIYSLILNIIFAVILMRFIGVDGLALAASISLIFNYMFLLKRLHLKKRIGLGSGFFKSFAKTMAASAFMGIAIEIIIIEFKRLNYDSLSIVAVSLVVGVTSYLFASFIIKNNLLRYILRK